MHACLFPAVFLLRHLAFAQAFPLFIHLLSAYLPFLCLPHAFLLPSYHCSAAHPFLLFSKPSISIYAPNLLLTKQHNLSLPIYLLACVTFVPTDLLCSCLLHILHASCHLLLLPTFLPCPCFCLPLSLLFPCPFSMYMYHSYSYILWSGNCVPGLGWIFIGYYCGKFLWLWFGRSSWMKWGKPHGVERRKEKKCGI